ncbi:MAG: ABC transporter permease [Gemmatimonadetes bacterium]|nr:ABC transporter permease [Gemmatimonadota bacterium]
MAPEQAAGDPATDHRADLYALGIVAWELLTGGSPYSGLTPQQVIAAQVTRTPPDLATRRYDVPAALSTLIGALLQKEPAHRPRNADQVLERLEDPLILGNAPERHAMHPPLRLPFALRLLLRAPLVSAVAIASLALGIGANTAVFSMVDQVLLRPLPVAAPDELVVLDAPGPQPGNQMCSAMGPCSAVFTYPMFEDLAREHPGLAGLAAHRDFGANIAAHGQTLSAEGLLVSGNYFPLLGLAPAAGRLLTPDDARVPGAGAVAVLAWDYWQSAFGGEAAAVGQSLLVNGQALEIVGVAPRGFRGTSLAVHPAVFVPVSLMSAVTPGWSGFTSRQDYWLYLMGRLAPGTTRAQAAVALNTTYHRLLAEVEGPALPRITEQLRTRFLARELRLAPGALGQSTPVGGPRHPAGAPPRRDGTRAPHRLRQHRQPAARARRRARGGVRRPPRHRRQPHPPGAPAPRRVPLPRRARRPGRARPRRVLPARHAGAAAGGAGPGLRAVARPPRPPLRHRARDPHRARRGAGARRSTPPAPT